MLKRLNQQCRVLCVLSAGSPPVEQMVTIVQGGDQGALDLDTVECRVLCAEDTETRRHQCLGGYMSVVRPRAHMLACIKLMMGE